MNTAVKKFFNGFEVGEVNTYKKYIEDSEQKTISADEELLTDNEKINLNYRKINLQRRKRIEKTFKQDPELVEIFQKFNNPQTWLVITEDWCGDSAQNLPYFVKYAEFNSNIEIIIISRDNNLEAIDSYFKSKNGRSIPKIIGFDEEGNELFIWGARPKVAQDLVSQLKAEGYTKEQFNEHLHLWYGRNRGKELIHEMKILFSEVLKSEEIKINS
jgi:hypothetical protein